MYIDREKILAVMAGCALYLLFGSSLEDYRAFIDSLVIADIISRIFFER